MGNTIAIVAGLITIIFAPIGCWLAYKSFPKERLAELKNEASTAIKFVIFLVVMASLTTSFAIEAASPEPLTRDAVVRMCVYTTLITLWIFAHGFLFILNSLLNHSRIMGNQTDIMKDHLAITRLTAEHASKTER